MIICRSVARRDWSPSFRVGVVCGLFLVIRGFRHYILRRVLNIVPVYNRRWYGVRRIFLRTRWFFLGLRHVRVACFFVYLVPI